MTKFKRKRQISKTSRHCSICGSQRRLFGWGNAKAKLKEKGHKHDKRYGLDSV